MKKQLLVLGLCLAVSTSAALACGNAAFDKQYASPSKKACFSSSKEARMREAKMNKERELLYNALNLTEAQKVQARAMSDDRKATAEPLFNNLMTQKKELKALKDQKASKSDIRKQKREVRKAKRAVKKEMRAAKKEFKSILTKEQKAKFKLIMKEKKAAMKATKGCPCMY